MITHEEAATIFMNLVKLQVYDTTLETMQEIITDQDHLLVTKSQKDLVQWYQSLDDAHKGLINDALKKAISQTIFTFLVLLDNKTTGYPLEDTPSEIAVYLQSAAVDDDLYDYKPDESVRLNMSYSGDDLHDRFTEMIWDKNEDD